MKIEIYGPGCAKCQNAAAVVEKVTRELGVAVEVVKVTDINAMLDKGILKTPAVYVDGRKVMEGRAPSEADVQGWLAG